MQSRKPIRKKGKKNKSKKKIEKVIREFKQGKLRRGGKCGPVATSAKQTIAITLSDACGKNNKNKKSSQKALPVVKKRDK